MEIKDRNLRAQGIISTLFEVLDAKALSTELLENAFTYMTDEEVYNFCDCALDENFMKVSNCCGAEIYEETDLCSDCKEHCGVEYEPYKRRSLLK